MKGSAFYGKSNQSPLNKALVGKQGNLPEHLKAEIDAAPGKMYDSPGKMESPVKGGFDDVIKGVKVAANTVKKSAKSGFSDVGEGFRQLFTGDRVDRRKKKAPTKMKSPVKGKFIDALKKGEFKKAGKVLSHEVKGIGAGAKEMFTDDYSHMSGSKGTRMGREYDRAKNKSIKKSKRDNAAKTK